MDDELVVWVCWPRKRIYDHAHNGCQRGPRDNQAESRHSKCGFFKLTPHAEEEEE